MTKYKESYEINPFTMAIIATVDDDGKLVSKVLETKSEFIVDLKPTTIVDNSCSYFGMNLRGAQEATRYISGITHKAPITIAPSSGLYFFPTASPINPRCSWISHSHVRMVHTAEHQCAQIEFKNGTRMTFDVSIGSMLNQVHKTAQYRYLLDERINSLSNNKKDPSNDNDLNQ